MNGNSWKRRYVMNLVFIMYIFYAVKYSMVVDRKSRFVAITFPWRL